jgi:dienelactone hydrolase
VARNRFTRRGFAAAALASGLPLDVAAQSTAPVAAPGAEESHIGNLYPFVQKLADTSPMPLSFLRPEFRSLARWQKQARTAVLDKLLYAPSAVKPEATVISRADRGDYTEETVTFQTTPLLRVPALVLIPKNARRPAPGIVALHDHGGFYLWGKEKVVARDDEHPVLTEFRKRYYSGRSTTVELVRQGYVVIVIDMFYWGDRRLMFAADPEALRDRSKALRPTDIDAFHQRCSQNEQLVARSFLTAGATWPGVVLWDDIRTVDYLASRPEVDPKRIGCVGLSVGGYRSFMLAALDSRIRAAVAVGWMTSYPAQIKRHVIHTEGFSFHVPLLSDLDLPDLAALIAPRSVMLINGSRDTLFNPEGVKAAFTKIEACYRKAGVPERQKTRMYDAPHEFNAEMQSEAWDWLKRWM